VRLGFLGDPFMDIIDFGRYLGALLLVLGLLGAAALGTRRFGLPGIVKGAATRRLALVETLMVGPRHKLFLLRRDGVEHLVLMGPQGASVVETGISAPLAAANLRDTDISEHGLSVLPQHSAEISA
jgi:flagellar protein FliO/FliZ